ncbi:MAG TPA: S8 family peptidase [Flavobacteriales bacterium]|nr:S8 family peptidase [Flavobacteriales bacterium]HNI03606.1 S8 family peptidase [Flavobacteriales bacterium]
MQRSVLLLPLVLCSAIVTAQERTLIGFQLGNHLSKADPERMMSLYLEGPTSEVGRVVKEHGGTVVMKMRNWTSVRIPAGRVHELDQEPAVRSIQGYGFGQTLNDSMRVKTHIDLAQQGMSPLPRGYDGSGVVMGIVDTGIDLNHPDMRDSTGTRVLHFWDHHQVTADNTPPEFGFGQEWSKEEIDNGDCPLQFTNYAGESDAGGHGTTVAGTAAGNGGNTGHYIGAAPKADLIIVSAVTINNSTFLAEVTDGVKYIFDHATALGRPAVVNLSLGSYLGSHDGLDPSALFIDSMITAAPGRSVVCAAGNSGCFPPYQLHMEVDADTSFAWIRTNSVNPAPDVPFAYIDLWGDTAEMNNLRYSVGADRVTGGYAYRGNIPFHDVQDAINTTITDTLFSAEGDRLAIWNSFVSVRGGQYNLEMWTLEPDSADLYWRIMMTGQGVCDAWDNNGFGLSEIVNELSTPAPPTVEDYPPMVNYVWPTIDRGIVDSWACSPHVISVANYNNEQQYTAINGTPVDLGGVEGDIAFCSARGPARTGLQEPDIAAPGDITFSAVPLYFIDIYLQNAQQIVKLGADTMHIRAGGTSIASPSVAGAVALYLQKCPYHTQAQVMAAFTGAAFEDGFTGTTPNNVFGHGKLDAFTPLTGTNFDVNVSGNDLLICPGDSSEAVGPAGFEDYLWSNGSTDQVAWSHGEPMVLTVLNDDGCISNSDTLFYTLLPEPGTPVITDAGGVLSSTPADGYQWYLNGTEISGATGQEHAATENGDYTVVVTAPSGCTAESDPYTLLNVGVPGVASTGFRVWPIPAEGTLFVTVDATTPLAYAIIDASGKEVKRGTLRPGGTSLIDLNGLVPGSYTLVVRSGERSNQRVFVVR